VETGAGPTTTVFQTDAAETDDDHFKNSAIVFTGGNLLGQARRISVYTGATGTITVEPPLTEAPANGDTWIIFPMVLAGIDADGRVDIGRVLGTAQTAGDIPALITALNDLSAAQVNTEVDNAIVTYGLDHLVFTSVAGADIADDSIIAQMVSSAATADWDTFVNTDDSLQAIRDQGDAAWVTGGGTGLTALGSGTARAGGTSTQILLATAETFLDNELNGNVVNIHTGTGAGQSRVITSNVSSTDIANVYPAWTTNPDATSQYEIVQGSTNIALISLDGAAADNLELDYDGTGYAKANSTMGTVTTLTGHTPQTGDSFARIGAAGVGLSNISLPATGLDLILKTSTFALAMADAIWDELLAGHVVADSAGLLLNDWQDAGRLDAILDTINTSTAGLAGAAMRGTDSALLASSAPTNFGDLAITVTTGEVTVGTNNDKTGYAIGAGGIGAGAFAANGLRAADIDPDVGQEFADAFLTRSLAGGSDAGFGTDARSVANSLRAVRNRRVIAGGVLTVYQENDTTVAWTGAVTTSAGDPISEINPT
jgi:hypothetical protein